MKKRIKKKKQKAAYKIPKQIIRLARRWMELDREIVFMAEFRDIENGHYPKKLVENCIRKYKRINVFLDNIEGDDMFRSNFFICHGAYADEQFDGEYCDQSCGYSGDDYHGVYYYPIGENLYFAYNYEC
ncbi:hypothetical protein [Streptococcus suis]|uniref:hypothetical protein n=1 Tax=Streptococcus suis TaxID=1307 RepID=UPI0015843A0C|nr:hypothetical protein [Streptococcus suis]MCQ8272068.1 hypothetical protein [Streptococcus suis]MDW8720745.1 hypothetical protein [Streptococcus suis]WNF69863.1 hypothetical protein RJW57_02390 [Streptococcus suis]HEL1580459.1 hypothetical protein [Streptococcus suis]HEL1589356.1 hypothetical protein [Streptococcus suis]